MNHALLGTVLVASFFGSLHCAGMCGPFVALYSGLETSPRARWTRHAAYHLGRLITYVALGAVAGALGSAVDLAGSAAGIARMSALVSGRLHLTSFSERLAAGKAPCPFHPHMSQKP